jgi:hypothetical protein
MTAEEHRHSLRITGLHVRDLKSIRKLDLPEDGLDWEGRMPDTMVIGGPNGSGKTTLLRFLVRVFRMILGHASDVNKADTVGEAWVDIEVASRTAPRMSLRFLIGSAEFMQRNKPDKSIQFGGYPNKRFDGFFFSTNPDAFTLPSRWSTNPIGRSPGSAGEAVEV